MRAESRPASLQQALSQACCRLQQALSLLLSDRDRMMLSRQESVGSNPFDPCSSSMGLCSRMGVRLEARPPLELPDAHGARAVVPAVAHEAVDVARPGVGDGGAVEVGAVVERHLGGGRGLT